MQALTPSVRLRNVGGLSYIAAIRDKARAEAAFLRRAAAAEGAFNYALEEPAQLRVFLEAFTSHGSWANWPYSVLS
jgi:hypothetical protein